MVKPEKIGHLHLVYHFTVPSRVLARYLQVSTIINTITRQTLLFLSKFKTPCSCGTENYVLEIPN